ncbi:unnamed protein product [Boreogadus saida]
MPVTGKVLASCNKYALATFAGLSEFTILFRVTRLGSVESEREEKSKGLGEGSRHEQEEERGLQRHSAMFCLISEKMQSK